VRTFRTKCVDRACDMLSTSTCSLTFDDSATSLIGVKNRGGLVRPAPHVLQICLATERATRVVLQAYGLRKNIPKQVIAHSLSHAVVSNLSASFACVAHCSSFIRELVSQYTIIQLKHESVMRHTAPVLRSKLNRLVLFSHV
jgi:hypothetical protein